MKNLPSISVLTITYNADLDLFKKSLDALKNQSYPKSNIEHIVIDGGSKNKTIELAKSYGCFIIKRPDLEYESEMRKSLGIKRAKNDIILFLESDNILVGDDWLQTMVLPFMEQKNIFSTFSMHNNYQKNMPLLTKYCALIGNNDPPVGYLKKADKIMLDEKNYNKGEILKDLDQYYIVKFTKENLPTLGDNGHMVKRLAINKVNKDPKIFLHTDAFFDLLCLGYNTYGVVKNSIIHHIGSDIIKLYQRRVMFKERFRDAYIRKRVYLVFDYNSSKDRWNLFKFMIFSFTFIQPLLRALRGYMNIHELAWFLNPVVCFVAAVSYTKSEIVYIAKKFLKRFYSI